MQYMLAIRQHMTTRRAPSLLSTGSMFLDPGTELALQNHTAEYTGFACAILLALKPNQR